MKFQNGVKFYYNFRIPDYNPKEIYDVSTLGSYITADSSGFKLTMRHATSYTEFKVEMTQDLYIVVVDNPLSNLLSPLDSTDDSSSENASENIITGTIEKGPIEDAIVDVYDLLTLTHLYNTTSASLGAYTATIPNNIYGALLRSKGGKDKGTNETTILSDADVLYGMAFVDQNNRSTMSINIPENVNITMLTTILKEYVFSDPNYATKTMNEIKSSKDSASAVLKNVFNLPNQQI